MFEIWKFTVDAKWYRNYLQRREMERHGFSKILRKSMETIQEEMNSNTVDNRNDSSNNNANSNSSNKSSSTLLKEADELAKSRNWTRDFALYNMYSRAMADGDKIKAERCMELLEREFKNSVW
ncbi:MAG: hypothetical protein ACJ70T_07415 [Nitrososphaera sp.]